MADNRILDVLFTAYVQNDFDDCKALMPNETDEPDAVIDRILAASNVTRARRADIFNEINEETYLAEKKGFENGFRIGARLIINLINGGVT